MSLARDYAGAPAGLEQFPARPFLRPKRAAVAAAVAALALFPGALGELTRGLIVDAYVQVSVFVAATLLVFYGAERLFRFNIGQLLRESRGFQLPLAALLGATPGCGGAVVVVAAYTSGNASFGAVVAALTATMGDAAFLLIATRPDAAVVILPLSFAVGILSGLIVDARFPRASAPSRRGSCELAPLIGSVRLKDIAYLAVAAPGLAFGAMQLLQAEVPAALAWVPVAIGLAGAFIGLLIWATSPLTAMTNKDDHPVTRAAEETAFISVWVIGAYLAYDYLVAYSGLNLEQLFAAVAPLLPIAAIVVGFIPGCGPQVLVVTLYVNGVIPFSAVLGNAISNDGDALFPAIALDPKAAALATLCSAVPATIVAYGFYLLAPGFMN